MSVTAGSTIMERVAVFCAQKNGCGSVYYRGLLFCLFAIWHLKISFRRKI